MKLFLLLVFLLPLSSYAGLSDCLSQEQFRALAAELAPKVNLFAEAWKQDPEAEFYGGTTRDYLYWLKGKFRDCHSGEDSSQILKGLRDEPTIDVRAFIVGDSDVDIVSKRGVRLDAGRFGVKKQDSISPEIFDPSSERGKNEAVQGYIPAEKIRLQQSGVVKAAEFGDGLSEIYSGKLTVHFTPAEIFAQGHYAKQGINHPILLALRYLRLAGINYYQTYGDGVPNKKILFDLDAKSAADVKKVIAEALQGDQLKPYLEKPQFNGWINGGIQKAFRSYTNPTAAMALMKEFGVDQLPLVYTGIEPMNQYLFAKHRDEKAIQSFLQKHESSREKLYTPSIHFFTDGYLYHGTQTEPGFRSILLQGTLASTHGSAGAGLYGVAEKDKQFSENWAKAKERLVRLPVKPEAKIVDINEGEGLRLWKEAGHGNFEKFADEVGADILKYPYDTDAYVVKNSTALGKAEGVYRKVLLFSDAKKTAAAVKTPADLLAILKTVEINNFNERESNGIFEALPSNWPDLLPKEGPEFIDFVRLFSSESSREKSPLLVKVLAALGPDLAFFRQGLEKMKSAPEFDDLRRVADKILPDYTVFREEDVLNNLARLDRDLFSPQNDEQSLAFWYLGHGNAVSAAGRYEEISKDKRDLTAVLARYIRPKFLERVEAITDPEDIFRLCEAQKNGSREMYFKTFFQTGKWNALLDTWRERGLLDKFISPIQNEADLMARLESLTSNAEGEWMKTALFYKILPELRAAARLKWPGVISLASQVGEIEKGLLTLPPATKHEFVKAALISSATEEDVLIYLSGLMASPTSDAWTQYLFSPWGSKDKKFADAVFGGSQAGFPGKNFVKSLAKFHHLSYAMQSSVPFHRGFWEAVRDGKAQLLQDQDIINELKEWRKRNPHSNKLYQEGVNVLLDSNPKKWFAQEAVKGNNYAQSNLITFLLDQPSSFFSHPRAADWVGAYFEALMDSNNDWPDAGTIVEKIFSQREFKALPQASKWMTELLSRKPKSPAVAMRLNQALRKILVPGLFGKDLSAWGMHPLWSAWEKSLDLDREKRAAFIWKKSPLFLGARISSWRKSYYPAASCPGFFGRLLGR